MPSPPSFAVCSHLNNWLSATAYVSAIVAENLQQGGKQLSVDADLFTSLGADSLTATRVRSVLAGALTSSVDRLKKTSAAAVLPADFVYTHSTITRLADALLETAAGRDGGKVDPEEQMKEMIQKYAIRKNKSDGAVAHSQPGKATLLIVGVSSSSRDASS